MNLQQLRYFVVLGEELHFRRAAERLNLSQPALTRSIKQLERAVGHLLFERDNRNVALTRAGREYFAGTREALAAFNGVADRARRMANGEAGVVRVGYTDIAVAGILPTVIRSFRAAHPDIAIEANHACTQVQIDALEAGQLDLGVFTGPWAKDDYATWTVQRDAFVAVLPAHHRLARASVLTLKDIAEENFVLGEPKFWTHYHAHLDRLCKKAGFEPRVVQYASNNEGILGLVACGMGVSVQAESIRIYGRTDIVVKDLANERAKVPTIAAWRDDRLDPVTAKLVAHIKALYAKPSDPIAGPRPGRRKAA